MTYRNPDIPKIIDCLVNFYNYNKIYLYNQYLLRFFNDINTHYKMIYVEYNTKPSDLYPFIDLYLNKACITFDQYLILRKIANDYIDVLISLSFF